MGNPKDMFFPRDKDHMIHNKAVKIWTEASEKICLFRPDYFSQPSLGFLKMLSPFFLHHMHF